MSNTGPILGITLFSLTNEWQQRLYTFDSMIARVAELGLGPAIEVVGFQSFKSYPDIPDDEAKRFRALLDRHGLMPGLAQLNHQFRGFTGAARIVDGDGETFAGQLLDGIGGCIEDDALVARFEEPTNHVATHAAEAEHRKSHASVSSLLDGASSAAGRPRR